jgi:hypothetical protein
MPLTHWGGMSGHPRDQMIMNIHADRLVLAGFDDQGGTAFCARE